MRETKLSESMIERIISKLNIDYLMFNKMSYICLCFAQDWALSNKQTLKIIIYRFINFLKLKKSYKFLKKFNA